MSPLAAFVSFRFGPSDGVSVVTRTWLDVFARLGFEIVTVSGGASPWPDVAHRAVDGLGIDDPRRVHPIELRRALADAELVVVENLLTIPIDLDSSRLVAELLAGRPALLHHHDPPWHRERYAHVRELPAQDPAWRHVAITRLLHDELAERGIASTVIRNGFAAPRPRSDAQLAELRATTRHELGVDDPTLLIAHPVRAIARKDVPAAIELTEALGGTYWLLGPAEEGYGEQLSHVLASARCPVLRHSMGDLDAIYAAADHVVFPSTWEGFGNPPVEASLRRRTVSVGPYPVADELRSLGFEWFELGELDRVRAAIAAPDDPEVRRLLDRNEATARQHLSLDGVHAALRDLLDEAGWLP